MALTGPNLLCFYLFIVPFICTSAFPTLELGGLNIKKVDRKIDLSTQIVKIKYKIVLENGGSGSVKHYWHCLSEEEVDNYSVFKAKSGGADLKISEKSQKDGISCYKFGLNSPIAVNGNSNVDVELWLTNALIAFPKSISQGEKQFMEYIGNHYVLTPYPVATQTSLVTVYSPNVLSFSRLKPSSHSDTTVTYGPYENVKPFSQDAMKIHYENNSPFLTVTSLDRLIELSHWGNIAVEETIEILHTGALFKGAFSRYDYQREHNSYSTIKDFKTILPASAKDVYYRDEIGNISTSNMRVQEDAVELDLRPRFPLFGGWKTKYTIGYNIPSYEHLYYSGSDYLLKMRFLDHVFDEMVVNDLNVKIILPEGVKNVEFKAPYDVQRFENDVHYTYLDTFGRTVIKAAKKNLVEFHIQDFELSYTFPSYLMLQEPFLIFSAFILLFLLVIIYVRLDFTISKDDSVESKMRISSHCEMVHNSQDKRASLYEKLEEEIQKLKTNKDISHSQLATKKLFNALKEETQAINDLAAKLRVDNAEYAEKVAELQKNDKQLVDVLQQQVTLVEKLVGGKMSKHHFIESEGALQKKKEAILEKVKSTLSTI